MQQERQLVIGLTAGDPFGIGPEVTLKALADPAVRRLAEEGVGFVVFGSASQFAGLAGGLGIAPFWWGCSAEVWRRLGAGEHSDILVDTGPEIPALEPFRGGGSAARAFAATREASRAGGEASLAYLNEALNAAALPVEHPAHLDAVVTAPVSKHAWRLAGIRRLAGHTELLAERFNARRVAMMFVAPQLRVVLATVHIPLMAVGNDLTIGRVNTAIDLGAAACREHFGIERPRIAVCGLNPHASEAGMFGSDEERVIEPAIRMAVEAGIDASGPYPADTIFNAAIAGRYDLVVAMYHDQGLIPVKLLARDEAVNVTLGLPIVRTSPDHGTAFDIAGRGIANPGSMRAAIVLATEMARNRREHAAAQQ